MSTYHTTQNSNNYLFFISIYKFENAVSSCFGAYCNFPAVASLQTIYDKIDILSMKWFLYLSFMSHPQFTYQSLSVKIGVYTLKKKPK